MRTAFRRSIPLWALLLLVALQSAVTYGAVSVLYHNKLAAFGTLKFTGEVEIIGFDIYDEQTVSVSLKKTDKTELGIIYTIGVAADNTMGAATVSWITGDPDAKKVLVQMGEPIISTVTVIKVRVENSGQAVSL